MPNLKPCKHQCIIDGYIKDYDLATPLNRDPYKDTQHDSERYLCIGNGYIWMVDGIHYSSRDYNQVKDKVTAKDGSPYTGGIQLTFYVERREKQRFV